MEKVEKPSNARSFCSRHSKTLHRIEFFTLLITLFIGASLRFNNLNYSNKYIFDECYHVPTAKLVARGDPRAFEWSHGDLGKTSTDILPGEPAGAWIEWTHPPLYKYSQALSLELFGENNPAAWRLVSAFFGALIILLVYYLTKLCWPKKTLRNLFARLLGALFVAVDPMLVTQSRIGMNDTQLIALILLGVIFWKKWLDLPTEPKPRDDWLYWLLSMLFFGLAISTKWSAMMIGPVILFGTISKLYNNHSKNTSLLKIINKLSVGAFIIALTYLASYAPMFIAGKDLNHFGQLQDQMLRYHSRTDFIHSASSTPFEWIIGQKPIWYSAIPTVHLRPNPIINFSVLISAIASIIAIVSKSSLFHSRRISTINASLLMILSIYLILFLPWILSPRIMFLYHYLPAYTFGLILLAFWLSTALGKIIDKFYNVTHEKHSKSRSQPKPHTQALPSAKMLGR